MGWIKTNREVLTTQKRRLKMIRLAIIVSLAMILSSCSGGSDDGGTVGGAGQLDQKEIDKIAANAVKDIKIDVPKIDIPDIKTEPIDIPDIDPIDIPSFKDFDFEG